MSLEPMMPAVRCGDVLVVDDDALLCGMLRDFLEDEGYMVREAHDGQVALELLRRTSESWVVLADHIMPRLSGAGLIFAVVADPQLRTRHAFIYMTAAPQAIDHDLQRHLDSLRAPTLYKPFSLIDCLAAVAAAVERLADET